MMTKEQAEKCDRPNKEYIDEINKHISDALEQWCDILMTTEYDEWAYFLNYSDKDLFNALLIFNHVFQNRAIKSGYIKEENAEKVGKLIKKFVKEAFDIDTVELSIKALNEKNKQVKG